MLKRLKRKHPPKAQPAPAPAADPTSLRDHLSTTLIGDPRLDPYDRVIVLSRLDAKLMDKMPIGGLEIHWPIDKAEACIVPCAH